MIMIGYQGPDTERGSGHGRARGGVYQGVDGVQARVRISRRFYQQG